MEEKEIIVKRIKANILLNTEMSKREFEFAKLNANLFKDIKFIKKRKAKRKWQRGWAGKIKNWFTGL